jgi:hypothetical protein
MTEPEPATRVAGPAAPAARGGRRPRQRPSRGRATAQPGGAVRGTVTMQARVDARFARELEADAAALGLQSTSDLVREGLRLVHKQASEQAMAASYEEFYGDSPAPVSPVTAALWRE